MEFAILGTSCQYKYIPWDTPKQSVVHISCYVRSHTTYTSTHGDTIDNFDEITRNWQNTAHIVMIVFDLPPGATNLVAINSYNDQR